MPRGESEMTRSVVALACRIIADEVRRGLEVGL